MTYNFEELQQEAKKANCEVSIYEWTVPQKYRQQIHTDNCTYIGGSVDEWPDMDNYIITDAHIMDGHEMNRTIYANSSEVVEPDYQEMIIMVKPK